LELLGESVYWGVWARGLVYVLGNVGVLWGVMEGYHSSGVGVGKLDK